MMDLTEAGLIQLARNYYPSGFPVRTDDYSQELHPYQRTPEYARWRAAWTQALVWPEWKELLRELRGPFGNSFADCTQPWGKACRRCCVYVERPLPGGARWVIQVAAAASILAPLYVTYCTTTRVEHRQHRDLHFSFEPLEEVREQTAQLALLVEHVLGYQPFPLQLANVKVPGIRVSHIGEREEATLLDALFDDDLANLP
ncbi:hypothetical protein [Hyalangium gracile]|uniref:hypothetical protein n=1 Tax=Hyalangium gracile TaxID=394092 RepID=UPI001CCE7908|nr:hypothetical protein [Hyalangium gracile]